MHSEKIIVVGSSNMDMVVQTRRIPAPGETVMGRSFFMMPGGKGANQAVAVARLGATAIFVTRLGNDLFGRQLKEEFKKEGMCADFLIQDDHLPNGVATITVDENGENSIVVAPGANAAVSLGDVQSAFEQHPDAHTVLLQLEIPMNIVGGTIELAVKHGMRIVLNPAPARLIDEAILKEVDILTPNATEAALISGVPVKNMDEAAKAAIRIREMGVKNVIVTMGAEGALICEDGHCYPVQSTEVKAVDSTAAGDVFNAALCVALGEGNSIRAAASFACKAAALSVTRAGAQSSIPYRKEVN